MYRFNFPVFRNKGLSNTAARKWAIQTFIYGVFSMKLLLAYSPKEKKL